MTELEGSGRQWDPNHEMVLLCYYDGEPLGVVSNLEIKEHDDTRIQSEQTDQ